MIEMWIGAWVILEEHVSDIETVLAEWAALLPGVRLRGTPCAL